MSATTREYLTKKLFERFSFHKFLTDAKALLFSIQLLFGCIALSTTAIAENPIPEGGDVQPSSILAIDYSLIASELKDKNNRFFHHLPMKLEQSSGGLGIPELAINSDSESNSNGLAFRPWLGAVLFGLFTVGALAAGTGGELDAVDPIFNIGIPAEISTPLNGQPGNTSDDLILEEAKNRFQEGENSLGGSGWSAFVTVSSSAENGGDENLDADNISIIPGLDYRLTQRSVLGGFLMSSVAQINTRSGADNTEIDELGTGVYYLHNRDLGAGLLGLSATTTITRQSYDIDREVSEVTTTRGNTNADHVVVNLSLSYSLDVGSSSSISFVGALEYDETTLDGYTEVGQRSFADDSPPPFDIAVGGSRSRRKQSVIGFDFSRVLSTGVGVLVRKRTIQHSLDLA